MTEIHICIECEGNGFPTSAELSQRYAVQDAILEAGVGLIVDSGSGRGVMDLFVEVADSAGARQQIVAVLERLGLAGRATVSVQRPRDAH